MDGAHIFYYSSLCEEWKINKLLKIIDVQIIDN